MSSASLVLPKQPVLCIPTCYPHPLCDLMYTLHPMSTRRICSLSSDWPIAYFYISAETKVHEGGIGSCINAHRLATSWQHACKKLLALTCKILMPQQANVTVWDQVLGPDRMRSQATLLCASWQLRRELRAVKPCWSRPNRTLKGLVSVPGWPCRSSQPLPE